VVSISHARKSLDLEDVGRIATFFYSYLTILPLICTLITHHFVALNVTSDICQINQQNIYGYSVANNRIKHVLYCIDNPNNPC
jgi:hypothetical protein